MEPYQEARSCPVTTPPKPVAAAVYVWSSSCQDPHYESWGNIGPRLTHQVCILDGNKYNARCREVGEQRLEILEECEVLHNQKRDPLLHSSACKNDYHHPQARCHLMWN